MSWILTASGRRFSYEQPDPDSICIEDIAAALSKTCRFAGHPRKFYSVAQHSVLVASLLPTELQLEGLLHDAAEAYVVDLPSPLKALLPEYHEIESRIDWLIKLKFKLRVVQPAQVKHADLVALATEKRDLLPPDPEHPWPMLEGIEPSSDYVYPLSPSTAESVFIEWFHRLVP
jgi:uncharacterized protein